MKLTIVPSDNTVIVDGRALKVDCSAIDKNIHAVQWDGTAGEIETLEPRANVPISDIAPFDAVVAAWTAQANTIDNPPVVPSPPPTRWLVRKSTIIARLNDAGLLQAAAQALNADLFTRERWYAPDQPSVYNDAPEALALLKVIGADPISILAP